MRKITRVFVTVAMMVMMLGCTSAVFAQSSRDLVGGGTGSRSQVSTTSTTAATTGGGTQSAGSSGQSTSQTATTSRVYAADTGVADEVVPFAVSFAAAAVLLGVFSHVHLKRVRKESREDHARFVARYKSKQKARG